MSITTPMRPDELPNPDGLTDDLLSGVDLDLDTVEKVGDYLRLLDIPARDLPDNGGEALFTQVGCAGCHTPTLRTRADYPIEGDALGSEWKTTPLMGLRFFRSFLHDGRALTVEDAITAHGGEAEDAVAAFEALSPDERAALLDWVSAL